MNLIDVIVTELAVIVLELLDARSFSSLWFWLVLVTIWWVAVSRVFGVPLSIVRRAFQGDGQAQRDMEDLVRIHARRLHGIGRSFGIWMVGVSFALLTGLGLIGFHFRVELAQALFLVVFPFALAVALDLMAAARIDLERPSGVYLQLYVWRQMNRIRFIGLAAILISVIWGLPRISPAPIFGG